MIREWTIHSNRIKDFKFTFNLPGSEETFTLNGNTLKEDVQTFQEILLNNSKKILFNAIGSEAGDHARSYIIQWIKSYIKTKDINSIEGVLDYLEIPELENVKQRLAYFMLKYPENN